MEKKDFNEILKIMLETNKDYVLFNEVKVVFTYPDDPEKNKSVDDLDVQIHVFGKEFRRFGGSLDKGLTMVDSVTTVKELINSIKGALLIDSLLTNHGFDMMPIEEIKRELGLTESKELSTFRVKSQLLDGILGRITISQKS